MQSGPSQWSRFNVTRIRTTLSFGPSTRVTAQATNPSDYRAWRKRGRLTGPRRQGSRKRGARRVRGKARERESDKARERESSVLFARDGRVAIATGGCLLLRPAVVGWYRAVYGRKGCGVRGGRRMEAGGGRTGGVKRVRQRCRGNRRAEGHERERKRKVWDRGERQRATREWRPTTRGRKTHSPPNLPLSALSSRRLLPW